MCRTVSHIQASFNNTIVTITDQVGNTRQLEELGLARLPRFAQGHAVRGAAGRVERRQWRATTACGQSTCALPVPDRAASRPSVRWQQLASTFELHSRRHAGAAQRLPSAEAPSGLIRIERGRWREPHEIKNGRNDPQDDER